MNKTTVNNIEVQGSKVSRCLLGQIATDINSRLPEEPRNLTEWEKYKLIKSGDAKLRKDYNTETFQYSGPKLVESFTYPVRPEVETYEKAKKAVEKERIDRELAVDTAIRRLTGEAILEVITMREFLDELDKMSSQKW